MTVRDRHGWLLGSHVTPAAGSGSWPAGWLSAAGLQLVAGWLFAAGLHLVAGLLSAAELLSAAQVARDRTDQR